MLSFISDVNFAFKDASRIARLLLATSNIVPAHSIDCYILPGKLAIAEVHVYYTYCIVLMYALTFHNLIWPKIGEGMAGPAAL